MLHHFFEQTICYFQGQCIVLRKIERKQTSAHLHRARAVSMATESVLSFLPLRYYRQSDIKRPNTSEEKFPEINKQDPCLYSKSSSSLSGLTLTKEKTANLGRKNSPNLRVSRSRANTWEKEKSTDLPVESNEEVLVRVAQLSLGDIFVSTFSFSAKGTGSNNGTVFNSWLKNLNYWEKEWEIERESFYLYILSIQNSG